jgi:hypothetical protein
MKFFGEPEDALFRVKVKFDFSAKPATMQIFLRPKFSSVKEAEAFLYFVFGTGDHIGDISINSAFIYGANDSAKKWLENVQIEWENGEFVDIEKYHDI